MKKEFKTIVAIETTINQHTEYISGQSTTFNDKPLPQYNKDVQQAKEFNDEDDANTYLAKVHNPHHRVFNVVAIEIPILKDKRRSTRRKLAEIFFLFIACIVLVSCSQYTCPSINGGREPKDKTKRMTVQYKQMKDGNYLVTERKGFNTKTFITDCKPCK